jgi:regulator of protease activity HflC (stomatin/prohibitin superfamily)
VGTILELVTGLGFSALVVVILLLGLLSSAIKIVQEYERGVIFRLGRLVGAKGPGLFFIIPIVDRMVKVDLRVVTLDIPSQEAITKDNVTVKVNAVAYFRVVDPSNAIVQVEDYRKATWQIAQTTLRSVLGQSELDELLTHREAINEKLQQIIDEQTEPWGIKVSIVEVKDVELPETMKRAMARQAEAEREKRAKIIHADGEYSASERLRDAAGRISEQPAAIQLRYLQTLTEIAVEKNSTIIFPVPIEFFKAFAGLFGEQGETE